MKRPVGVILVAVWCSFALFLQVAYSTRPARAYQQQGDPIPAIWYFLPFLILAFGIWQIVGLIKLKQFNRWFAVVFLASWNLSMVLRMLFSLGKVEHPIKMAVVLSIPITLNIACAWFLLRRSFREFALHYVIEHEGERHSRLMQAAAQKNMQDEIRRNKTK